MKVLVKGQATRQISAIARWYEEQRPGLGDRFLVCTDARLSTLLEEAQRYPAIFKRTRRAPLKNHPYLFLYRVNDNEVIEVLAVIHTRRHPRHWRVEDCASIIAGNRMGYGNAYLAV